MEPIYSLTTLQKNPSVVKEAARKDIVRITEHGQGAYIFCSEEVFEQRLAKERADVALTAHLTEVIAEDPRAIEETRYATSIAEAIQRAAELRAQRGAELIDGRDPGEPDRGEEPPTSSE